VLFKQKWVELKYVPHILSRSSLNILNYMPSPLFRFGASQTKSFQYMASGKPICANVEMNYCPIKKYNIGIAQSFDSAQSYAEAILYFYQLSTDTYNTMCRNAKIAALDYDYRKLTEKFIAILKTLK
jgi:glycosyltransferase involved in cell wall biosynthesis